MEGSPPERSPEVQGRTILERYEQLYAAGEMSLSKTYADKFPLLEHLLKDEVDRKTVLDFGCGPGRLSLILARFAAGVHGIDFSAPGIEMARHLAEVTGTENASFAVGDLDQIEADDQRYDVVLVAGTIEHLADPLGAVRVWRRALNPSGLLVVQCPSFDNFRGDVYNTLGTLIGLPMSLTDVWQVHRTDAEQWAAATDMTLERVVGGHYDLAFGDRAVEDLRSRAPKAASDANLGGAWDWPAFFEWLERRAADNRLWLERLRADGVLEELPESEPLPVRRPRSLDDAAWDTIREYLTYTGWRERLFTDRKPYSFYGASAVYFFRATDTTEEMR